MNTEIQATLEELIEAADSGEWHTSRDCEVEGRKKDCHLCQAIDRARALITKYQKRGRT